LFSTGILQKNETAYSIELTLTPTKVMWTLCLKVLNMFL